MFDDIGVSILLRMQHEVFHVFDLTFAIKKGLVLSVRISLTIALAQIFGQISHPKRVS